MIKLSKVRVIDPLFDCEFQLGFRIERYCH